MDTPVHLDELEGRNSNNIYASKKNSPDEYQNSSRMKARTRRIRANTAKAIESGKVPE